jgi:hypothetical protein
MDGLVKKNADKCFNQIFYFNIGDAYALSGIDRPVHNYHGRQHQPYRDVPGSERPGRLVPGGTRDGRQGRSDPGRGIREALNNTNSEWKFQGCCSLIAFPFARIFLLECKSPRLVFVFARRHVGFGLYSCFPAGPMVSVGSTKSQIFF